MEEVCLKSDPVGGFCRCTARPPVLPPPPTFHPITTTSPSTQPTTPSTTTVITTPTDITTRQMTTQEYTTSTPRTVTTISTMLTSMLSTTRTSTDNGSISTSPETTEASGPESADWIVPVICVAVIVICVTMLVICFIRKRKKSTRDSETDDLYTPLDMTDMAGTGDSRAYEGLKADASQETKDGNPVAAIAADGSVDTKGNDEHPYEQPLDGGGEGGGREDEHPYERPPVDRGGNGGREDQPQAETGASDNDTTSPGANHTSSEEDESGYTLPVNTTSAAPSRNGPPSTSSANFEPDSRYQALDMTDLAKNAPHVYEDLKADAT